MTRIFHYFYSSFIILRGMRTNRDKLRQANVKNAAKRMFPFLQTNYQFDYDIVQRDSINS